MILRTRATRRVVTAAAVGGLFLLALTAVPAGADAPTMVQAESHVQAKDWPRAAEVLEALVAADPENGQAWYRLGIVCYHQAHFERGIEALTRADELGFAPAPARYSVAALHARQGHADEAFEWLVKAAQAGFNRVELLDQDGDFAALREDPRYDQLKVAIDKARRPCMYDERYGKLDFWLGEWDVVTPDGQPAGSNVIAKLLEGCAVLESWQGRGGGTGMSWFYFDVRTGDWTQVWVTSRAMDFGGTKVKRLIAELPDGSLRFQGELRSDDGIVLDRTTLTPLDDGRVRQVIETSTDGGGSWTASFDAVYSRSSPSPAP